MFVIGNVVTRGNPLMEEILNRNLPYASGPQWLAETLLRDKWVLGVAGTHGKTTTSSMLAWILEYAGLNPGFLILRHRGRRIRHGVFRQAFQVCALPSAHRDSQ